MRKIKSRNLMIIIFPILISFILIVTMFTLAILRIEPNLLVGSDFVFYDEYNYKYVTTEDTEVERSYDGIKTINYQDDKIVLSNSTVSQNENGINSMILEDGVIIKKDNSFYNVYGGDLITKNKNIYYINDEKIDSGTIIKNKDRNYIIIGDIIVDGNLINGVTSVYIDKAGNPTIYSEKEAIRYSTPQKIDLQNEAIFDTGLEIIEYPDGTITDLTQIGGTSSQYRDFNDTSFDDEEDASNEQQNEGSVASSTNNQNNNSTTSNSVNQISNSNNENIVLSPEDYEELFKKDKPSGIIRGIEDVTATSSIVNVEYLDASKALISSPNIKVKDQNGTIVFTQSLESDSAEILDLLPNTQYTAELYLSYDIGEGIVEEKVDEQKFKTDIFSFDIQINLLTSDYAIVYVFMQDSINLDQASIQLLRNSGSGYVVDQTIPLNTSLISDSYQKVEFKNLTPNTEYKIVFTNVVYDGEVVNIESEAYFETLSDSTGISELGIAQVDHELEVFVDTLDHYDYFEYMIYDKNDTLVTKRKSSNVVERFGLNNGLQSGQKYYAVINVINDEDIQDTKSTSPTTYVNKFKINSIVKDSDDYIIKYSGLPNLLINSEISLEYSYNGDEYQILTTNNYKFNFVKSIKLENTPLNGYYKLRYNDDKGTTLESEIFEYNGFNNDDLMITTNYYYVNEGDLIKQYDLNYILVNSYTSGIDNYFESMYKIDETVLAIDDELVINILNDEENKYTAINGLKLSSINEKEDSLNVVFNDQTYSFKKWKE